MVPNPSVSLNLKQNYFATEKKKSKGVLIPESTMLIGRNPVTEEDRYLILQAESKKSVFQKNNQVLPSKQFRT